MIKRYTLSVTAVAGAYLAMAAVAFAAQGTTTGHSGGHPSFMRPLAGTVSAVGNGSLTVSVLASSTAAVTTYTVETGSARILRDGTSTTASAIEAGDRVMVFGTLSGTVDTAKLIMDGMPQRATGPPAFHKGGQAGSFRGRSFASSTRPSSTAFARFGTVEALNGSSFTLAERTRTGTTTFAVDTDSGTQFREGTTTASFSNLAVGNLVAVTGTTTATDEILASKVMIFPKLPFPINPKGFGGKGRWKGHATSTQAVSQ
jgi:hypothetical protein